MTITALPTPPQRSDPTNFATRGDAFMTALPTFATEANALATAVNADAATASAAASTATTQASTATTQAGNASTSASTASTAATTATTQAGIATTQASNALASANAAAASAAVINLTAPGPIGSVTPSTGAFTTLSASGNITGSASLLLPSTTAAIGFGVGATEQIYRLSNSLKVYVNSADVATFSSTGLAVTGTVSASGAGEVLTLGASGSASNHAQYLRNTSGYGALAITSASDQYLTGSVAGDLVIGANNKSLRFGNFGTGALGVTLDASGNLGLGVTPTGGINACLQIKDGIKFPATQVASSDANTLDDYRELTYTATATGMTTAPTGTATAVRAGGEVTLELPAISGTSNATTFTLTGMPTAIRPSSTRVVFCRVQDNGGTFVVGLASISSAGVIDVLASVNGAGFTASGTKTISSVNVSYVI